MEPLRAQKYIEAATHMGLTITPTLWKLNEKIITTLSFSKPDEIEVETDLTAMKANETALNEQLAEIKKQISDAEALDSK